MNKQTNDIEGNKYWYDERGQRYRGAGHVIVMRSGTRRWIQGGEHHRTCAPAVKLVSGYNEWWINGCQYTEEEFTLLSFVNYNIV